MGAIVEGPSGDVRGAERLDIAIELGNAAMLSRDDVAGAICRALAVGPDSSALLEPLMPGDGSAVMDVNGNTVGRWWCS